MENKEEERTFDPQLVNKKLQDLTTEEYRNLPDQEQADLWGQALLDSLNNPASNNQKELPTELSPLTDYHWQRSKAAQEEVAEMLKHPYSLEQIRKQAEEDRKIITARK